MKHIVIVPTPWLPAFHNILCLGNRVVSHVHKHTAGRKRQQPRDVSKMGVVDLPLGLMTIRGTSHAHYFHTHRQNSYKGGTMEARWGKGPQEQKQVSKQFEALVVFLCTSQMCVPGLPGFVCASGCEWNAQSYVKQKLSATLLWWWVIYCTDSQRLQQKNWWERKGGGRERGGGGKEEGQTRQAGAGKQRQRDRNRERGRERTRNRKL